MALTVVPLAPADADPTVLAELDRVLSRLLAEHFEMVELLCPGAWKATPPGYRHLLELVEVYDGGHLQPAPENLVWNDRNELVVVGPPLPTVACRWPATVATPTT